MPQGSPAARRPRSYTPKVKGCHECSQRRIHCDRGQPSCQKCKSKDLHCSGYGIRFRFNEGAAARGRWAGKTIQRVYESEHDGHAENIHRSHSNRPRRNKRKTSTCRPASYEIPTKLNETNSTPDFDGGRIDKSFEGDAIVHLLEARSDAQQFGVEHNLVLLDESTPQSLALDNPLLNGYCEDTPPDPVSTESVVSTAFPVSIEAPLSDPLWWAEPLFLHFSEHIAHEMVAIDGKQNGYRHLLLPIARTDELVMGAVMTVSAFHSLGHDKAKRQLSIGFCRTQLMKPDTSLMLESARPAQLYSRTLAMLNNKHNLGLYDISTKHSILLSLLVLLVGVMVTGSEDFPILFRALESALQTIGGENKLGKGDLPEFLVRQIRKMRVYAAPYLGEDVGIRVLSSQGLKTQVFDCLDYCCEQRPGYSAGAAVIKSLVQQAQDIYLQQASRSSTTSWPFLESLRNRDSIVRAQCFKETLESFPDGAPGKHVVIWAAFIAASDCITKEHKAFFREFLLDQYCRNGFTNILRGLELLEQSWASRDGRSRWTAELSRSQVFVM